MTRNEVSIVVLIPSTNSKPQYPGDHTLAIGMSDPKNYTIGSCLIENTA
jgi:hypothetical protein